MDAPEKGREEFKALARDNKEAKSTVKIGGKEVKLYGDHDFARIRKRKGVPEDFLSSFKFEDLSDGGGKGGSPIAFLSNGYIVKELAEGDHVALLEMRESLCSWEENKERSLLVVFLLHFEASGRYFAAMTNVFYVKGKKGRKVIWKYQFDLKGCRDDKLLRINGRKITEVHKRWYMFYNCWFGCDDCLCTCCGSEDRRKYMAGKSMAYDGKLPLSKKQKEIFSESIRRDVEFLKSHQVMDYSLLVGVQSFKTLEEAKEAGVGDNTYLCRTTDKNTGEDEFLSYHFGIVDFFQKWVLAKTIARCLKTCFCAPQPLSTVPPDIYAQQFRIHLTKKFLPIAFDPVIDSAPVPVEDSPSASITPRKGRSSGECKSIGTQGASSRASVSASGSLQGPAETGILSQRERKV